MPREPGEEEDRAVAAEVRTWERETESEEAAEAGSWSEGDGGGEEAGDEAHEATDEAASEKAREEDAACRAGSEDARGQAATGEVRR